MSRKCGSGLLNGEGNRRVIGSERLRGLDVGQPGVICARTYRPTGRWTVLTDHRCGDDLEELYYGNVEGVFASNRIRTTLHISRNTCAGFLSLHLNTALGFLTFSPLKYILLTLTR